MHLASKTRIAVLATALVGFALTSTASAQTHEPPSVDLPFHHDTGYAENTGQGFEVVHSFPVTVENTGWLRLHFSAVELSGDVYAGTGSMVRVTSLEDGAVQSHNEIHVKEWDNYTAYFNGDSVLVEVLSYPNTGASRVVLDVVTAGTAFVEKSQCGGVDDRVLSTDPRAARLMTMGCTGWLIDDAAGCLLSAGHCGVNGSTTVQFNVPLSTSSGSLRHPGPEDQYSVDAASVQSYYGGIGNDYAYYGVHPNSTTGLTPAVAQGSTYILALPPSFSSGQQIRVTGYGVDYDTPTRNQVEQTNSGNRLSYGGSVLEYVVDTEGGNSGSPVIFESTGEAIGIHTNGGCSPPSQGNLGTGLNNGGLQSVLATPRGVCDDGLRAEFVGNPRSGMAPLLVAFTDSSTGGAISWSWNFGDGGTSNLQNPGYNYLNPGTFTVTLTVGDGIGYDSEVKTNYIVVDPALNAYTNSYNGSGINPMVYTSTNLPVLGTAWKVDVDGGSIGASGLSFVVGYSAPIGGVFTAFGELLIDTTSSWMLTSVSGGSSGISHHTINIPNDPVLAGLVAFTQGFLNNVGGSSQLTNAIEAGLGY